MNWKGFGRKRPWPISRHYSGIYLEEGVGKCTTDLGKDGFELGTS
jgi:hypothetical protein